MAYREQPLIVLRRVRYCTEAPCDDFGTPPSKTVRAGSRRYKYEMIVCVLVLFVISFSLRKYIYDRS